MHHNGKTRHASMFRWHSVDGCLINLQHCAPVDMLLTHEHAKISVETLGVCSKLHIVIMIGSCVGFYY